MGWRDDPAWPDVDVVMPVRDEADHLERAVDSVRAQDYPGDLRIFLGVATSIDGTEDLAARLAEAADDVTVVANPVGATPAGLNVAISAGSAPVIVRVDGHSQLSPGYVRRAVVTLRATGAANVGGRQVPVPRARFDAAVAAATTSWLGTGGATYRRGGRPGPVDTVYLGVFDRDAIEAVGLFDERLIRNQDYELNIRLRNAGHAVWFDPELRVGYRPRETWRSLARQYFEYGWWKAAVMRRHPEATKLRQVLPPLTLAGCLGGAVLGHWWRPALVAPAAYTALVLGERLRLRRPGVGVALVTIHAAWSAGLVAGLLAGRASPAAPDAG